MWWGGQGGGVPFDNIKGRALFVWLSVADSVDWSRVFAPVMGTLPAKGPFADLPPAMAAVRAGVERCIQRRPPVDQTTPPSPSQSVGFL